MKIRSGTIRSAQATWNYIRQANATWNYRGPIRGTTATWI